VEKSKKFRHRVAGLWCAPSTRIAVGNGGLFGQGLFNGSQTRDARRYRTYFPRLELLTPR